MSLTLTTALHVALGLFVGYVVAFGLARATRSIFEHPTFTRTNYRGESLPTGVGLVLPITLLAVGAASTVVATVFHSSDWAWTEFGLSGGVAGALLAGSWMFASLGLLDDLVGAGESGGFRGHLRALADGRLTSGGLKMFGGAAAALGVGAMLGVQRPLHLLVAGATMALWANVGNLFDRAPGRTAKVTLLSVAVMVGVGWVLNGFVDTSVAVLFGAAAALMLGDLAESFMLGDAGSNVLGFMVGFSAVTQFSLLGVAIVGAIGLALNLASEFVSFSRIIDSVPPLRALDRLGAPHRS